MLRGSFQLKLFLIALSSALIALIVAALLMAETMRRQANTRLEETLVEEARLAAELLRGRRDDRSTWTPKPIGWASSSRARVTLVAASGRVLGDSSEPVEALAALENHLSRPEIEAAARNGIGRASRHSATLGIDMLYVAARVHHPQIAFVRLALPLDRCPRPTAGDPRGDADRAGTGAGRHRRDGLRDDAPARPSGARHRRCCPALPRPATSLPAGSSIGDDELGTVARALDETVENLAGRIAELARDRGRMAAILAGMVEGVIVVDSQGRLAARERRRPPDAAAGQPGRRPPLHRNHPASGHQDARRRVARRRRAGAGRALAAARPCRGS